MSRNHPTLVTAARRTAAVAVSIGSALTLVACGQAVQAADNAGSAGVHFVDAGNCGITTEYSAAPERAVTLTSNATETMLELGLADRIVGTAYLRGREIAPGYADDYGRVPVLSSEQPTMEQLIDTEPDFVYSGYPDGFGEKSGHTREQLADLGIDTHLTPEGCATGPVGLDDIFAEITVIGDIFGVPERAATTVDTLGSRLDAVAARLDGREPVRVLLYASGTDTAATTGGNSMATALIEAAGGVNVFADMPERWMNVSWEQVAERAPDVIVVREEGTTPQYRSPSVETKIGDLNTVPVIADIPAIREQDFATITLSQLQPGPYSIDGVEHLARQLHPDAFR